MISVVSPVNKHYIYNSYSTVREKIANACVDYDIWLMLDAFVSESSNFVNSYISPELEQEILMVQADGDKLYSTIYSLGHNTMDANRINYAYNYFLNSLSFISNQSNPPRWYYYFFIYLMYENVYTRYEFTVEEYREVAIIQLSYEKPEICDDLTIDQSNELYSKMIDLIKSTEDIQELKQLALDSTEVVLSMKKSLFNK